MYYPDILLLLPVRLWLFNCAVVAKLGAVVLGDIKWNPVNSDLWFFEKAWRQSKCMRPLKKYNILRLNLSDWLKKQDILYFTELIAEYKECLRHALTSKSRSCPDDLTASRGIAYSSEKCTIFDEKLGKLVKFSEKFRKYQTFATFLGNRRTRIFMISCGTTKEIAAVRRTTPHDECGFTKFDFIAGIRLWSQENKFHINLTVCSIRKMTGPSFVPINKLCEL